MFPKLRMNLHTQGEDGVNKQYVFVTEDINQIQLLKNTTNMISNVLSI